MLNNNASMKEYAQIAEEAARNAKLRARNAKWDRNVVIFMFAIRIITASCRSMTWTVTDGLKSIMRILVMT